MAFGRSRCTKQKVENSILVRYFHTNVESMRYICTGYSNKHVYQLQIWRFKTSFSWNLFADRDENDWRRNSSLHWIQTESKNLYLLFWWRKVIYSNFCSLNLDRLNCFTQWQQSQSTSQRPITEDYWHSNRHKTQIAHEYNLASYSNPRNRHASTPYLDQHQAEVERLGYKHRQRQLDQPVPQGKR